MKHKYSLAYVSTTGFLIYLTYKNSTVIRFDSIEEAQEFRKTLSFQVKEWVKIHSSHRSAIALPYFFIVVNESPVVRRCERA